MTKAATPAPAPISPAPKPAPQPQSSVSSTTTPPSNSLHPSKINYKNITDKAEQDKAKQLIDDWYDTIRKDVHALLAKHGVTVYEIGFVHDGSRNPMVIAHGHIFEIAKLSVVVARELRGRVAEELTDQ